MGIVMALSSAFTGISFSTEPQVSITPKWSERNSNAKECGGFTEDSLILKINIDEKEITDNFCSSYGRADAKIIQDARDFNFLILKTAQGHGTYVTTQYLTVYRIDKYLDELARLPVFEPLGRLSGASYDYKIEKPKNGGLLFLITVRIEGTAEDAAWFPKEKK
jgi:hypothetical protein